MNRVVTWLLLLIVLTLGLASWISALDATGDRAEGSLLFAATAVASALLVLRLVRRATP